MSDPLTLDEYNTKWKDNYKIEGYGITGMTMHYPCPFCCEPEFMTHTLLNMHEIMQADHICVACSRGSKSIIKTFPNGSINIELVQTCGENPPSYLPPMRRV